MTDVRAAAAAFAADRDGGDDALRAVLAVDESGDAWTFDDVDIDSGTFGELVSRGIVEKEDGGYRVADRAAVRAALDGEEVAEAEPREFGFSLPSVDRRTAGALSGSLLVLLAFRLFALPDVYQLGRTVLLANDPYYYRYWLFQFLQTGGSPLTVPEGIRIGEPLYVLFLQVLTTLLGGTERAANLVLAWYPVVTALVTGVAVYLTAVRLTDDRRVGVASVLILAVTPAHAYRTAIGFSDHHPFDFFVLSLSLLAVVALTAKKTDTFDDVLRADVLPWAAAFGITVGFQVLAWNAGPLLLLPLAVYALLASLAAVDGDTSPLARLTPLAIGLALGSVVSLLGHYGAGWQETYMAITPLLLLAGTVAVALVAEGASRRGLGVRVVAASVFGAGLVVFALSYVLLPEFGSEFVQQVSQLFLHTGQENIAEVRSLFSTQFGIITGPFFFFGLSLFFAIPAFAWAAWHGWNHDRPAWLVASAYAWVFFVLTIAQVRFAGELAIVGAVFGGFAFVWLANRLELAAAPGIGESSTSNPWRDDDSEEATFTLPDARTVGSLFVVFLLIGGLCAMMTPIRTGAITHDASTVQTANAMNEYAETHNQTWPENYVFSEWSNNRVYNAFVSGQSKSYGYARANYVDFLTSTNGSEWYQTLGSRRGFVVTQPYPAVNASEDSLYYKLQEQWGVGTKHYRAIYGSENGKKAFETVEGATITGPANGSQSQLSGTITVDGQSVDVNQNVDVNHGVYVTNISNPGTYTVNGQSVTVSEDDVADGDRVSTFDGPGVASYSFNEGEGDVAYDRWGGHHAKLHNVSWTEGVNGSAVEFNGSGYVQAPVPSQDEFTVSLWVKPDELDTTSGNDYRHLVRGSTGAMLILEENGRVSFRIPGGERRLWMAGQISNDEWSHITAVYNGESRSLYINGENVGTQEVSNENADWGPWIRIGGNAGLSHTFNGSIDSTQVYGRALTEGEVKNQTSRAGGQ
ncbi:LamG-like jellyroll fold domain-containing protein [Halocalculus aciditolerans]|uniref:dolichyl-phosphooligosaccharide-protein glycotransferase n=1 Tax=Halocalculus aciditolerans TaxID=1383812 RepID=A0A830F6I6_9EURY|nr:LamG-like jellyroll fold domain-containing protein [Halocalculus aciditolerans]GGL68213.1 hypothetical protein GCM10009039_27780 [Halocalculus aciditolerans]